MNKLRLSHFQHERGPAAIASATLLSIGLAACSSAAQHDTESATAFGSPTVTAEQAQPHSSDPTNTLDNPIAPTEQTRNAEYRLHEDIIASVFWIGEGAGEDNDGISNTESAWSSDAVSDFGGVDDPLLPERNFTPKHNSFYVAVPANEFTEAGPIPGAHEASPWADEVVGADESLFKGRWLTITADGKVAYAQWQDTGPCADEDIACERDYDYVFGDGRPVNQFKLKAGIDLSPDLANFLGIDGEGVVSWSFIDADEVPDGPWKQYPAIDNKTHWKE